MYKRDWKVSRKIPCTVPQLIEQALVSTASVGGVDTAKRIVCGNQSTLEQYQTLSVESAMVSFMASHSMTTLPLC